MRNSSLKSELLTRRFRFFRRTKINRPLKYLVCLILAYLSIIGLVHNIDSLLYGNSPLYPSYLGWILTHWGSSDLAHWSSDATADIQPINCVSHNDYWRSVPLYTAISLGCVGAEADIWSLDNEDDIFVGHTRWTLTRKRTLRDLYVGPLVELLGRQNRLAGEDDIHEGRTAGKSHEILESDLRGVFDTDPSQTFVLLIDFKSFSPQLWLKLIEQLSPLRERHYLTHFDGTQVVHRPVTVVASGSATFDILNSNRTYRDVFFDAPLEELADLSHTWPNPNLEKDPSRCQKESKWRPGCRLLKETASQTETDETTSHATFNSDSPSTPLTSSEGSATTKYNSTNSYYASVSFKRSIGSIEGTRLSQSQLQLIRGQIKGAHQRGLKVRYWGLPRWPRGLRNHVWHILGREGVDVISADDLGAASGGDWRRGK